MPKKEESVPLGSGDLLRDGRERPVHLPAVLETVVEHLHNVGLALVLLHQQATRHRQARIVVAGQPGGRGARGVLRSARGGTFDPNTQGSVARNGQRDLPGFLRQSTLGVRLHSPCDLTRQELLMVGLGRLAKQFDVPSAQLRHGHLRQPTDLSGDVDRFLSVLQTRQPRVHERFFRAFYQGAARVTGVT
jgi:hypothetical protein